jgi:hypothetical protein
MIKKESNKKTGANIDKYRGENFYFYRNKAVKKHILDGNGKAIYLSSNSSMYDRESKSFKNSRESCLSILTS